MNRKHDILDRFIVIEGADGAGTTTQAAMIAKKLALSSEGCHKTSEPTDLPVGSLIRAFLSGQFSLTPRGQARLFATDRYEHLYSERNGILSSLKQGQWVVCDRYLFSSLAYQGLSMPLEEVLELNPYPLPQHLFFLDIKPADAAERLDKRGEKEIFEKMSIQTKVIENYKKVLNLFSGSGMKIITIDAKKSIQEIHAQICSGLGIAWD